MAEVGGVLDPRFEEHDTGPGHPERPERLRRVLQTLEASGLLANLTRIEPRAATDAELHRVHDAAYVRRVEEACRRGETHIDSMDTAVCAASARIAREASGAVVDLCREVAEGKLARGFAAVRPPGHHAERALAMGFCLFNHVAVAARALQETVAGIERVLIVDWDVHHGNGTQHLFETDGSIFYFSLHQWPLYPGTGAREERGRGAGEGTTLNCPLPAGAGDEAFLGALRRELVPAARHFKPDFVLISAGFDAHRADPLAQLEVETASYAEATRILLDVADEHAGGRCVSLLEGGYDLDALSSSVLAHFGVLVEH